MYVRLNELEPNYYDHISKNIEVYYSDFVSRFMIEYAGQLVPWWRISSLTATQRAFFAGEQTIKRSLKAILGQALTGPDINDDDDLFTSLIKTVSDQPLQESFMAIGEANVNPESYPYLWLAEHSKSILSSGKDPLRRLLHDDKNKGVTLADAIRAMALVYNVNDSKHNYHACSDDLQTVFAQFKWFDSPGQGWHQCFVDDPTPNLVIDLLIGLYGYPYHANVEKMLRLNYRAEGKSTTMFTDVFVLDQARYLYDFVPALPLFKTGITAPDQFVLRACMGSIIRHACAGYPYVFRGSRLGKSKGFTYYSWPNRDTVMAPPQ